MISILLRFPGGGRLDNGLEDGFDNITRSNNSNKSNNVAKGTIDEKKRLIHVVMP